MTLRVAFSALLAVAMSFPAFGQHRTVCREDGIQPELNACARDRFEKADRELNMVYQQVTAKLEHTPLALERLRRAQRLWLQLRDADLDARFPVADGADPRVAHGSIFPMVYALAKADMTRARAQWLRHQFLERNEYDP